MILHIVDDNLLVRSNYLTRSRVVSILVRHHVEQFHRTVRSCSDGQWDIHRLAVCVRRSGIGRDILIINIYRTLDEPVVGRNSISACVLTADVVAVVDNGLRTVYEVTRCLPRHVGTIECEVASGNGISIQGSQSVVAMLCIRTYLMYVLGIYEATTHTWLHVDKVELNNTGDVAPVLLIQIVASALLCGQLQIHT